MAIDLPPMDAVEASTQSQWQQQIASHGVVRLQAQGRRINVFGTHQLLDEDALAERLSDVESLEDARGELLQAMADAGYVNVVVAGDAQGDAWHLWVLTRGFSGIDGPKRLTPYFKDFAGDEPIQYSDFAARQRLAQLHARRAGFEPVAAYKPVEDGTGRKQMLVRVNEVRSAWDYAATLGNTGNRYFGRWTGGGGVSWTHPSAWRLGGSYERAFPELGDDPSNADYDQFGLFVDRVRPWGVVRFDASYSDYSYEGNSGRRLFDVLPGAERPLYEATNTAFRLSGEHFLYLSKHWTWSLSEAISHRRYRTEDVRTDRGRQDERYSQASAAVSARWINPNTDSEPMLFARTEVRQGLGAGELDFDAQDNYTAFGGELGAASNVFKLGRIVISGQGQHSSDPLPEGEEWVLGGMDRLNAWLPGVAVGDLGYYARIQYNTPTWEFEHFGLEFLTAVEQGQVEFVARDDQGSVGRARLADAAIGVNVITKSPWKLELRGAHPIKDKGLNPQYLESQEVDFFLRISRTWDPA